ncbi:hypothetical protein [Capnocytophaga stomatis]|uniref:Uncharacterized protein n=1 Tax=Capnocytophaga stomatis TaxID=1848904 RepID=A0A250G313_9FLAO|nr:hypothetical protein [Capnocytophaga stomatis]ATA90587.1 hypothetical protein CGC58_05250 [Capnocytophaga stomatis]GIJ94008.1 hypothetical protein CAPN002_12260 [Capnocytophaga stomatis]GIJ96771.1 hypothetical protein CAPN001_13400 [Capnocytophaga stomatis]GIM48602.1 hypothetical protein CAPN003_00540 [Capnocytophaga stomatis]
MQKTYYFHLFLARVAEGKTKEYNTYIKDHSNPLFFKELEIYDYSFDTYGIEVLQPEFQYDFPLSELLKFSLLKRENLPIVEEFCKAKNILPNSYIILYHQGLKIPKEVSLSYPDLYYIGEFEMDKNALMSKKLAYPHLF